VLVAALGGPDGHCQRADDEKNAQKRQAGRVVRLPMHRGGHADGHDSEGWDEDGKEVLHFSLPGGASITPCTTMYSTTSREGRVGDVAELAILADGRAVGEPWLPHAVYRGAEI
jgi:hypothetical protein